ncbi:transcriptional regulator ATRX-like isoform X1 [Dermacentor albipictus]|uniref:transcriptional regulator ATRX-like isoform X1 n=2 Tax=Dermacentor albipictus TaxID=60249 RepID=UPI0031FBA63C
MRFWCLQNLKISEDVKTRKEKFLTMDHPDISSSKTVEEGCATAVEPDLQMPVWMSSENPAVWRPAMTVEEIANLRVLCTSCGAQLDHHCKRKFRKHKLLKVIVCKRCYQYYGDGQLRKEGSDSDEYCSWCAEGGILVLCDRCGRVFCKGCIRRNFSRRELNRIELLEEWQCYVCDPTPLEPMVNYASMITSYSRQLKKQLASSTHSKKPKFSEADLKDFVLKKAREIKRSLLELARRQEGFLADASKVLRDHASSLSHIAKNVETCRRRQLRSVKRAKKKKGGKNGCLESSASVDYQPGGSKASGNEKLIAINKEQNHVSGSDQVDCKDKQVQERNESCSQDKIDSLEVSPRTEILNVFTIKTEADTEGYSVGSTTENDDVATCGTLNIPSTLSTGDEFSSLAQGIKCKAVSETLVADLNMENSSDHCSIPSKNHDKETTIAMVKTENFEEVPSSGNACSVPDVLSSSSTSDFETCNKSVAFKLQFDRKEKDESSTDLSSEEDSSVTSESSQTVEEWEQKTHLATRRNFYDSKKRRTRVGSSAKAKRSRYSNWLLSDSTDSSSDSGEYWDDEWRDLSRRKPRARKRKAPSRRKRASRCSPPLSKEVIRSCLEEAFKRYKDPKLLMNITVDLECLPVDHSLNSMKRMMTETDGWNSVEELKDACNIAKTRSYDSSDDGDEQDRPLEPLDGHEEGAGVSPTKDPDGKGRRNIRKLISDEELAEQTKAAAQAEEERKQRIAERRKLYYEVLGTEPSDADVTVKELVLEVDLQTKEPLVQVNEKLVKFMKPHQVKGVKFLYDCVIESLEMLKNDPEKGSGCILAHCMGLGKTFQVISFLHTMMTHKEAGPLLSTALVVCPYNTVLNWANEFEQWLHGNGLDMKVYEVSAMKADILRLEALERWHSEGGVAIIGYSMFCLLVKGSGKRKKKAVLSRYRRVLLDPGPQLVICDEGHVLKNDRSGLSKAMSTLKTGRRIVLTGTPLQNNLKEYHCMVSFIKPGLLGTKTEFINRFVNPIANGQCADCTVHDVKLMKKRVHVLHRLLDGCVQRCDKSALASYLPPKHEYVVRVRLSDEQVSLYRHFLEHLAQGPGQQRRGSMSLFTDFYVLQNISTHPLLLELSDDRVATREFLKDDEDDEESDSAIPFIDEVTLSEKSTSDATDEDVAVCLDDGKPAAVSKEGNMNREALGQMHEKDDINGESGDVKSTSMYHTRSRGDVENRPPTPQGPKKKQWWDEYVSEDDIEKLQISGKMSLLYNILQECDAIGDKVLLFSQSLLTLDLVERLLEQCHGRTATGDTETVDKDPKDQLQDCHNTWVPGIDYFRLDGATSVDVRSRWISMFNDENNHRGRLFLVSTRAGSLGTNLVGANRVVLMDASWNPTHDVQAIFRVYRFGQKKPVFIYRLLAQGTMEEKIYNRQVTKQALSCRVVDKQQIERLFSAAELLDLYTFNPVSKDDPQPTPKVPSDRLLAELLIHNKDWIVSYHEHDSLLQNVMTEELTEEEHKLAWEEYKNEREGRLTAAATSTETDTASTPTLAPGAATAKKTGLCVSACKLARARTKKAKRLRKAPRTIQIPAHIPMNTVAAVSSTSMPMLATSVLGVTTTTSSMQLAAPNFTGTNMTNVLAPHRIVQVPIKVPMNAVAGDSLRRNPSESVAASAAARAANLQLISQTFLNACVTKHLGVPKLVQVPAAIKPTGATLTMTGLPATTSARTAVAGSTMPSSLLMMAPKLIGKSTMTAFTTPRIVQVPVTVPLNTVAGATPMQVSTPTVLAPAAAGIGTNLHLATPRLIQVQVPVAVNTAAAAPTKGTSAAVAAAASTTSAAATSGTATTLQMAAHKLLETNNTKVLAAPNVVQVPAATNTKAVKVASLEATSPATLPVSRGSFERHMIAHKFINLDPAKAFPVREVANVLQRAPAGVDSVAGAVVTTVKTNQNEPICKPTDTSMDLVPEVDLPLVPMVLENVAGGLSTQGSGDNFRLVLDIYKMISDIKSKSMHLSTAQLVLSMKSALLEYRLQFQRQQCSALEEKRKLNAGQAPALDVLDAKLKETRRAIELLNTANRELDEVGKKMQKNQKLNRLVQVLPLLRLRLKHMLPQQRGANKQHPEQLQGEEQQQPQQDQLQEPQQNQQQ